jgi:glycosyltransferase involved in cell wall biosynthesis
MDKLWPIISVIMPVRNEAAYIEQAVKSLLENDYPADRMELIVVDGASEDKTRELVSKMAERDKRIKLLDNPQRIVPPAMNMGIAAAEGKYIVRVDAHAEYAADYIRSCVEVLERTGAGVVGGYMETRVLGETVTARTIAAATSSPFGVGGSKFRIGGTEEQEVDTVPFGAFRREVFEKVGQYHPLLVRNQDIELSTRIRNAGFKIIISPKIKLTYYNRPTFSSLRHQCWANGLWNAYTLWLTGGGLRPRHLIPAVFVAGLIVLSIMALVAKGVWCWLWIPYLGLYLTAGLGESLKLAFRKKEVKLAPLILAGFLQMHLWYGFGTLWGFLTAPFKFTRKKSIVEQSSGR